MVNIIGISKRFASEGREVQAINRVSLDVPEGKFLTLLGQSGCGKTTTLRCLAGLEHPESGQIMIDGKVVFDAQAGTFVPPEHRPIGMVFQSYAIWPHMTVSENIKYPLTGRSLTKVQVRQEVDRVLSLVGLQGLADQPAPRLSGGQQQRVALARALVVKPKVLLLDEPLSNLDANLRKQMRVEIKRLQQESGVTAVYVTHDQEEAMAISDEIVFMSNGSIVEQGLPEEIYAGPKKRLTAEFFGDVNFLVGKVVGNEQTAAIVETAAGQIACSAIGTAGFGDLVSLFFRPENARLLIEKPKNGLFLNGIILNTIFLGRFVQCTVKLKGDIGITVDVHPRMKPKPGEVVYVTVNPEMCHLTSD
jgi:ABC-type Fe3+/spermidine/putrescine transport system ATPase subunit